MTHATSQPLYPIKLYLKYHVSWSFIGLSLLLNIATWIWVIAKIKPQADPIFLHYNILFGVDYIGDWWRVYGLGATGSLILFINFLLGWFLFAQDKFISLVINAVSFLSNVFLLIAAALLVFLNV